MEWRFHRNFSPTEQVRRIQALALLPLNFVPTPGEMNPSNGWNQVRSRAVIGRGKPAFDEARRAVETLSFSDPRVVEPHFDPASPLLGRRILLELKAMGLHMLVGVQVGAVIDRTEATEQVFGLRFDTLQGHVEMGQEWFWLTYQQDTQEVRFSIEAAWLPGEFPNAWTELGFHLVGRRYQRAWHHLAHQRLREMLAKDSAGGLSSWAPVQFWAGRALARGAARVEREDERMRRDRFFLSAGYGVLAGMRSLLAPAVLSRALRRGRRRARKEPAKTLSSKAVSLALVGLAAAELALDKASFTPSRTSLLPLLGRAASGSVSAAAIASEGDRGWALHLGLGAGAALLASFAFNRLRQAGGERYHLSNLTAGLLEDAAAVALSAGLLAAQH